MAYRKRPEVIQARSDYLNKRKLDPTHSERRKEYVKNYRSNPNNLKKISEQMRAYYSKPEIKNRVSLYQDRHDVKSRTKTHESRVKKSEYRKNPNMRKWLADYMRKKYRTDERFAIKRRLHERIRTTLKLSNAKRCDHTLCLLGCSIDEFREYLQSKFEFGMSWDNRGEWHIDHIIPCSAFDLTDPNHQKRCFHYTNLQPLWAAENLKKGRKFLW